MGEEVYTGTGVLINSGEFDGVNNSDAHKKITQKLQSPKEKDV